MTRKQANNDTQTETINQQVISSFKFIIPPHLCDEVKDFKAHFDAAIDKNIPTIICGDTGVGKSLFLQIYKHLYKKKFPDVKDDKLHEINCAHFEPSLAGSELFGHLGALLPVQLRTKPDG